MIIRIDEEGLVGNGKVKVELRVGKEKKKEN